MFESLRTYGKQLFFVKRVPKVGGVPLYYKRPKSETDYQQSLEYEGLIAPAYSKTDDLSKYPVLKQDLADLEEHLMPTFWDLNQKAMSYQNTFYLYQWIFMLGAFFTTLLGAVTTYSYIYENRSEVSTALGMATAFISAALSFFNVLNEQISPQKRWATNRRLTEELRTTYYKYLAHLEPFHSDDRVQQMRQTVLAVRRKENENV